MRATAAVLTRDEAAALREGRALPAGYVRAAALSATARERAAALGGAAGAVVLLGRHRPGVSPAGTVACTDGDGPWPCRAVAWVVLAATGTREDVAWVEDACTTATQARRRGPAAP